MFLWDLNVLENYCGKCFFHKHCKVWIIASSSFRIENHQILKLKLAVIHVLRMFAVNAVGVKGLISGGTSW